MKKLLASLLLGAAVGLSLQSPAHAERTLRVTLQVPTNHEVGQNVVLFKKTVEEMSKGEINVEIYDAAQLYKGSEVPQAVSSGAIDMGLVLIDEFAGTIPAASIFSVAFMFPDYDILAKAAAPDSPVRKTIDDAILKTGARGLWYQDYGPVQLLGRRDEIRVPADIKGKKVRVLGKPSGDFIEAVGAVPVKVGGSEQFVAYQRGTVDVGMTGTTAIRSRKLYEVMNSVTITNHAQTEFLIVMSEKTWQALSDQEKKWVHEAAMVAEKDLRNSTKQNNLEAEEFIAKETKMKVIHLTPEELAEWKKAAEPAVDAYIKEAGDLGKTLVEQVRALY